LHPQRDKIGLKSDYFHAGNLFHILKAWSMMLTFEKKVTRLISLHMRKTSLSLS